MKVKLEFNNRAIANYNSNFLSKNGNPVARFYTPFQVTKKSQFKGLKLCEYQNGSKYFVLIFTLKGEGKRPRYYTVGKFNPSIDVVTGETIFGVKQCTERLFKIVKEHCDERGHWIKDPNLNVSFTLFNKSITVRDLIVEYAETGFERMRSTKKLAANSIRAKVKYLF